MGSSAIESAPKRAALLLERAIFYSTLALIVLTAIPYGTVEPWSEAFFECVTFILAALCITECLLGGSWHISSRRVLLPLITLFIFAIVQTLPLGGADAATAGAEGKLWRAISADPYETRLVALKILALTLTVGLLLRYTSGRRRLHALIHVVVGVAVASALFGILRQATQGAAASFVLPYLGPYVGYGQFINPNHFAFLMEMALGLVLGLAVGGGMRRYHLSVYLAAAALVWSALVLSNSRGGILSTLSQLVFIVLVFPATQPLLTTTEQTSSTLGWLRRMNNSLIFRGALILCLVLALIVSMVWMGGEPLVNRLSTIPGEFSTDAAEDHQGIKRVEIWRATWRLIKDNPVAGVGFGGYRVALPHYHEASGKWTPQQAHNDYLELMASGGILGVLLGAWFVLEFIRRARASLRSPDAFRRAACYGALAGLFGVAVHSLVDFGLHITVNALVFVALLVIATVDSRLEPTTGQKYMEIAKG